MKKSDRMKAITIKQPFASLIREGYKEYEFRTWKTSFRGEIYIHAGLGIDKEAMNRVKDYNLTYPSGCIIAKAKITDCVEVDDNLSQELLKKNEKVYYNLKKKKEKRYGFKIEDVEKINPIPVKGKLSLWDYKETK